MIYRAAPTAKFAPIGFAISGKESPETEEITTRPHYIHTDGQGLQGPHVSVRVMRCSPQQGARILRKIAHDMEDASELMKRHGYPYMDKHDAPEPQAPGDVLLPSKWGQR